MESTTMNENVKAKMANAQNEISYIRKMVDAIEYEIQKGVRTSQYDASYVAEKVEKAQNALNYIIKEIEA